MQRSSTVHSSLLTGGLIAFALLQTRVSPSALIPVATIQLPKVAGRIDHLAFDPATRRVFVAALGNNTLEVIDTVKNVPLRSLAGFHEPQGIAVVSDLKAVAVANGDTGTLQLLDAETLQTRWVAGVGADADNVRYDAARKQLYVAAVGGLTVVDPATGKVTQKLAIAGHPESFQLERVGPRVFANLPGFLSSEVIVGDRQAMTVRGRWSTGGCRANYPMALDESSHVLFVGCRRPATLAMLDVATGKPMASTPIVGDTDDLFYDAGRRRIYVIGGEGFVQVVERGADALRGAERIPTRAGARTGLWVADQSRLYVAVPKRGSQPAEIRVYEARN